jgi:hypothetical protein
MSMPFVCKKEVCTSIKIRSIVMILDQAVRCLWLDVTTVATMYLSSSRLHFTCAPQGQKSCLYQGSNRHKANNLVVPRGERCSNLQILSTVETYQVHYSFFINVVNCPRGGKGSDCKRTRSALKKFLCHKLLLRLENFLYIFICGLL